MNDQRSALIVDDERDIRELLVLTLGRMGLRTETASSLGEARALLAAHRFDLCLTDMRLPDGSGIDLIGEITQQYPNTPVAMITAFGNVDAAVEALKAGAFDFVSKPVDLAVLRGLVKHALDLPQKGSKRSASIAAASDVLATRLFGDSPAIVALKATLGKVARSQAPVYIAGESGVGKELVARTIHEQGARGAGPFVPVNCGAIPAELMESEFFGHKKGSFTGAHADKPGLFQAADGGTLFLDEVAELPLPMQVKLLRAIQEKSIRPVGANAEVLVDVRILSATHKDLGALVNEGRFRHDLYYRINVIELRVPPLRERRDDLPGLADAILRRLSGAQGRHLPALSADAVDALRTYPFPGNVRELENILERAMALAEGDVIELADLRLPVWGPAMTTPAQPGAREPVREAPLMREPMTRDPRTTDPRDSMTSALPSYIEEIERNAIQQALEDNRYNKTKAAAALGITFRALRYKLKKLGID
ncbi:sigma-54-dependent Fis family transcriptional regulator [Lysobacter helvus]|uniref:Sigma-54-dependent Fis family transcriptional regulator n=2 Tax=Lysobacteraceae TaxID=32033 RepID=A0ABM7Q3D3_9GAMM|nr:MULTISPECIES: sigma-54 dependent transcriptional regulator [Lysobacter]BCT91739.1 sigma-54-dependent Fis family transcriptional regulator [Lysobacter caseinilyticus]BCT94892.1 sigma-54-dependent Fis family transcriptional regulator [Lysobacter helvus]